MSSSFGILFSLKIAHAYYSGNCEDFEYLIPSDAAKLAKNRRIITRTHKGIFYAFCEKDDAGIPLIPVSGIKLRIGMRLKNPYFSNITRMDFKPETTPLYRNLASPGMLDNGLETRLMSSLFSHKISKSNRPVTITLKDVDDVILQTALNDNSLNTAPVPFDLRRFDPGLYTVTEKYTSSSKKFSYYSDPELHAQQPYAIIELNITDSFFTSVLPPEFVVRFTAKEETLKYYIIGKNYSTTELNNFLITDAGYSEDARPQVLFSRVSQSGFVASDIPPSLLTDSNSKVVLFKSQNPVARFEKARRKIQLVKKTDVIMKHLPLPGIDRSSSDIIIQISKP